MTLHKIRLWRLSELSKVGHILFVNCEVKSKKKFSLSFNPPSITKQMSELAAMAASTLGWQWQPPLWQPGIRSKIGKAQLELRMFE